MTVPLELTWTDLAPEEKRAHVLMVADALFARDGIETSMPALASGVGVGVGSLYRLFANKEDIVAALLLARVADVTAEFEGAIGAPDPHAALERVAMSVAERCTNDWLAQHAWERASGRPEVVEARLRSRAALDALVTRAREAGALRADAAGDDLRLAFMAAKHVEDMNAGGARRLVELVLRGMAA